MIQQDKEESSGCLIVFIFVSLMIIGTIKIVIDIHDLETRITAVEQTNSGLMLQYDNFIPPAYAQRCHWCHFN
ncbi:MAG: hypothetical protein FD174_2601 [Geobacteraceae bacterium]|nr:MAG: hypothetical protein FD174_2601 [Geobacteraceae bacterium]